MENVLNELRISFSEPRINSLLGAIPDSDSNFMPTMGFNQNEEFFVELDEAVLVPSFPIHHDVRTLTPSSFYIESLFTFIKRLALQIPTAFSGLSHLFEPAEPLKPGFFNIYRIENCYYLYVLRIDTSYRALESTLIKAGDNDKTAEYSTKRIFLESELIPVEGMALSATYPRVLKIQQYISNTWIGETGRGYQVRGIWMDADLSKFFTKLFMPEYKVFYPFLPYFCKYKTICGFIPLLGSKGRKFMLPVLHRIIGFLKPEMETIQNALKKNSFSAQLPEFLELSRRVPGTWRDRFSSITITSSLNSHDMKEFSFVFTLP